MGGADIAMAVIIAVTVFCLWQVWKEERHNGNEGV